jgi:hypothetical protein
MTEFRSALYLTSGAERTAVSACGPRGTIIASNIFCPAVFNLGKFLIDMASDLYELNTFN